MLNPNPHVFQEISIAEKSSAAAYPGLDRCQDYYHCFSHQVAAAKLPVDRLGQLGSWGAGNYYCRVKLLALIGRTNISISLEAIF